MGKTEPMLVPEWLRFTANVSGGGASINHPDDSSAHSTQSRSCYLNRSSSVGSRHTSTTDGKSKHPYSNFSRRHIDRNRAKECFSFQDVCNRNYSCPTATTLQTLPVEKGALRHSRSLVSKRPVELLHRRVEVSEISGKDLSSRKSGLDVIQKIEFEKDFPSLRSEEKQSVAVLGRVLSPCLASTLQTLPVGGFGVIASEKWTSALAEVPAHLTNNGMAQSHVQLSGDAFLNFSSSISGLSGHNMAEAFPQPTAKVLANPLLPDKNQQVEELAIKQSRQLIPLTPMMPKPLTPSSADKLKQPKIAARINEMTVTSRLVHGQPSSSPLASQSRCGKFRTEFTTASHFGKFLVLKAKDSSGPNGDPNGKIMDDGIAIKTSSPATSISNSNYTVSAVENKVAALSLSPKATLAKRSYKSLPQSRREFLNLMRKKTSCSPNNFPSGPTNLYISSEDAERVSCTGDRSTISVKTNVSSEDMGGNRLSSDELICPDEEEAAFLRSLGWEENGGEDELSEEEINAFYEQHMKARPSSNPSFSSQSNCLLNI